MAGPVDLSRVPKIAPDPPKLTGGRTVARVGLERRERSALESSALAVDAGTIGQSRRAPTQRAAYQSSSRLAIPTRLPVCLAWMKRPPPT
jgi:hypothetical protein